jgi:phosphohistidine phosphatase
VSLGGGSIGVNQAASLELDTCMAAARRSNSMNLYLLRHGEADWPDWDKPDDERPLTNKGKKEMKRVAELLCALQVCPARIVTSPLPRAQQTAEIVAKCLDRKLTEDTTLRPGFTAAKLKKIVARGEDVMIVGHEPDFSRLIQALTGGQVKMAKAGFAQIELDPGPTSGRLISLLPPKLAKV